MFYKDISTLNAPGQSTGYTPPPDTLQAILAEVKAINAKLPDLHKLVEFLLWGAQADWSARQRYINPSEVHDFVNSDEWKATNDAVNKWTGG